MPESAKKPKKRHIYHKQLHPQERSHHNKDTQTFKSTSIAKFTLVIRGVQNLKGFFVLFMYGSL